MGSTDGRATKTRDFAFLRPFAPPVVAIYFCETTCDSAQEAAIEFLRSCRPSLRRRARTFSPVMTTLPIDRSMP